jgi:ankyrin repeat protein
LGALNRPCRFKPDVLEEQKAYLSLTPMRSKGPHYAVDSAKMLYHGGMRSLLALVAAIGAPAIVLAQDKLESLPASEIAKIEVGLRRYFPYAKKPGQERKVWAGVGVRLWNQSLYEVTEIVYEAQVFGATGSRVALKKDVAFNQPFADNQSGYIGSLLPWQESTVTSAPFLVAPDMVNRPYWGIIKSAKGYRRAKDFSNVHHFLAAVARGDLDTVRTAIQSQPALATKAEPRSGVSALHVAATADHLAIVKFLVEQRRVSVNLPTKSTMQAIHIAAWARCPDTVRYLLKKGVSPNQTYRTFYPVHCAAMRDSIECYKILVAAGAKINPSGDRGITPIHNAARYSPQVLKYLLDQKVSPNQPECAIGTPLHQAILVYGKPELTEMLLKAGANPNAFGSSKVKWTPLHAAIQRGNAQFVEMLCKAQGRESPSYLGVRPRLQSTLTGLRVRKAPPRGRSTQNKHIL